MPPKGFRSGHYRTCRVCGASFYVFPSMLRTAGYIGAYCSVKCWHVSPDGMAMKRKPRSERAKERYREAARNRAPRPLLPDVVSTCEQCGGEIRLRPKQVRGRTGRFCTYRCWVAYLRMHPERSALFVDGNGRAPYAPGWTIHLKERVMERDRFMCVLCGVQVDSVNHATIARERAGAVHHIDWNKTHHAPSNLVTLCARCHGRVHVPALRYLWCWRLTVLQATRIGGLLPAS